MRQLTGLEVIIIFGGYGLLFIIVSFFRLRYRRGHWGLKTMALCYYWLVPVGAYLMVTSSVIVGMLILMIAGLGILYEYGIGIKL